jgi:hypothetical protein
LTFLKCLMKNLCLISRA